MDKGGGGEGKGPLKPTGLHSTKDGISRCKREYDVFCHIQDIESFTHKNLPQKGNKVKSKEKDAKKHIEAEFALLMKTMWESLPVFKFLKIVVIAVGMPPYLLICGIPKWFGVKVWPIISRHVSHFFGKIQRGVSKQCSNVNAVVSPVMNRCGQAVSSIMGKISLWTRAIFVQSAQTVKSSTHRLLGFE